MFAFRSHTFFAVPARVFLIAVILLNALAPTAASAKTLDTVRGGTDPLPGEGPSETSNSLSSEKP